MAAWLDALRENSARPLVPRLKYLDALTPRGDLTPQAVLAALEDYEFQPGDDVARGLVRLVPGEHWLALARLLAQQGGDGRHLSEEFVGELDFRLVPVASAALEGPEAHQAL